MDPEKFRLFATRERAFRERRDEDYRFIKHCSWCFKWFYARQSIYLYCGSGKLKVGCAYLKALQRAAERNRTHYWLNHQASLERMRERNKRPDGVRRRKAYWQRYKSRRARGILERQ